MDAHVVTVALDERDPPTGYHCDRVSHLALELGRACGLVARELRALQVAAAFHDVGKIGIPDDILKKATPFTEGDWVVMKTHSARSQRIILAAGLEDGDDVALAARHHHERFDGTGYPDGLAGEAIPFMARIVALADTYDAMAWARGYRPAWSHERIMTVIRDVAGSQHDPYLCTAFVPIIERSPFKARGASGGDRIGSGRPGDGIVSGH